MIIQAAGRTLPELLEDSGRRLFAALTDPDEVGEALREKVVLSAPTLETLLTDWANTLLELARVQHILLKSCRVLVKDLPEGGMEARADILGELFDPQRHSFRPMGPCQRVEVQSSDGLYKATLYF